MTFKEMLNKLLPGSNKYTINFITDSICPDDVFGMFNACPKAYKCTYGDCWERKIKKEDLEKINTDIRERFKI